MQEYVYGAPNINVGSLKKILSLDAILQENEQIESKALAVTNEQTSGIRMRFYTTSPKVRFKLHTSRKYPLQNVISTGAFGFDFYFIESSGLKKHITVMTQNVPNNDIDYELSLFGKPRNIEIYFPSYTAILDMVIGIEEGSTICQCTVPYRNKSQILFYGNSCTQGASASRSGNAYPNIVSRKLDCDIVNYSFSAACRAEQAMAQSIIDNAEKNNSDIGAIVIDYQRNAASLTEFYERYEPFYYKFRNKYPTIPIILIGATMQPIYGKFIKEFHRKCKLKNENTFYIDLDQLFCNLDSISLTPDRLHYTDEGMFLIADKICDYILQSSSCIN